MNKLVFHVDEAKIPPTDVAGTTHVFLYGPKPVRPGTGSVGGPLEVAVRRLAVVVDRKAMDFLSIALAVIAADTYVSRERFSANGWAREFNLDIPLARPEVWHDVAEDLENALNFLSGDRWTLSFRDGGMEPPVALRTLSGMPSGYLSAAPSQANFVSDCCASRPGTIASSGYWY